MNCRHCHTAIPMPGGLLCGACDELLEEAEVAASVVPAAPARRAPKTTNIERRALIQQAAQATVEHARARKESWGRRRCTATNDFGRRCTNPAKAGGLCPTHEGSAA